MAHGVVVQQADAVVAVFSELHYLTRCLPAVPELLVTPRVPTQRRGVAYMTSVYEV